MSNRFLQVAGLSACILITPRAVDAQTATPPVAGDAGARVLGPWQGVLASGAFRERLS